MNHLPSLFGLSQCHIILRELQRHAPELVPMVQLGEVAECGAVHSRISDLRAMGYNIPPATVIQRGRKKTSFYRLIPA
jgi:hypothetical protein